MQKFFDIIKQEENMKTGIFVGKFQPAHKGHKFAIEKAVQSCDQLFLIVCDCTPVHKALCEKTNFPYVDLKTKTDFFKKEFAGNDKIKILSLSENNIPTMPFGWKEWTDAIKALVDKKIDVIFGSEKSYEEYYRQYMPESKYVLQDQKRKNVHISSTLIRENPAKYFDFIMDSAKPFYKEKLNLK